LDTRAHGVVQDTWESDSVSVGASRTNAQGPLEGVSGEAMCEQSKKPPNNPLSDPATAP